jgi:NAD+ diphosphatase
MSPYAVGMNGTPEQLRLPFATLPLDRAAPRRRDQPFLDQARTATDARLLLVADHTRIPIGPDGALGWRSLVDAGDAGSTIFLGVDEQRRPLFSREARPDEMDEGFVQLRDVGARLADHDAAAAVQAVAVAAWHRRSAHCPLCGGHTAIEDAGHRRRCVDCGTGQFPRTDPAVIMLVTDGERCVLGRRAGAPAGRWSTLAGFVEAGESLEAAVAREVYEEVGLTIGATRYCGSQPWPFPASLMVAFEADAAYAPLVINDEHQDVRWWTRDEIASSITAGEMTVPPAISAGGFLIRRWLGPAHDPFGPAGPA